LIKVAVIGCGSRGRSEMKELSSFEDVELVAACDPMAEALSQAADEFAIPGRFDSIERMLDAGGIDAAFVTTPAHLNAPSALPCLEAGVDTLLEKPPGLHVEETVELAETAKRSGARGMVGWQRRFNPFVIEARRLVEERGPVMQLVGEFHKNIHTFVSGSRFPEIIKQRVLFESPIHSIDLVRALAGSEVAEVHSVVGKRVTEYNDLHAALVTFESGCVAQISANLTGSARLERYEIHGHGISAYLEGVNTGKVITTEETVVLDGDSAQATRLKDQFFLDCIRDNRPVDLPAADLDEAVKTMKLGEAIYSGA